MIYSDCINIFSNECCKCLYISRSVNTLTYTLSHFADGDKTKLNVNIPRFPVNFTGTGDLFASLLLGWMHRTDYNLKVQYIMMILSC